MKKCSKCKEFRDEKDFYRHNGTKDKLQSNCRFCSIKHVRNYQAKVYFFDVSTRESTEKTKRLFLTARYRAMVSRCKNMEVYKRRGVQVLFSEDEFIDFGICNTELEKLLVEWSSSGFLRKMSPSIDRIDVTGHYELGNIQFITSSQNSSKDMFGNHYRKGEKAIP